MSSSPANQPTPSGPGASGPTPSDPASFARTRLDFHPDPLQSEILLSPASRCIVNCSRQWGKSTVAALKAVHFAFHHPDSLVLVAAPSERQSAELVRKARRFASRLSIPLRPDPASPNSILFPNHSRILAVPGREDTIRGFSANLLIVDEASRVPDALFHALTPMLAATSGSVWLLSTPFGRWGFFYEIWSSADPTWSRFRVPVTDCPRIPPTFLDQERLHMPEAVFRQEYHCEFIAAGASVFDPELIQRALDHGLESVELRLEAFLKEAAALEI